MTPRRWRPVVDRCDDCGPADGSDPRASPRGRTTTGIGTACHHPRMRARAVTRQLRLPVLAACVVAALLTPPHRSRDEQLRRRVLVNLAADPATAHVSPSLSMLSGVATVSGQIADSAEHARTLAVVAHTAGVMDVIDELTVSDRVIVQRVREAFLADATVGQLSVAVTSVAGEVTLRSDQTNAAQRRQLVQLAARIDGVVHVIDAMK